MNKLQRRGEGGSRWELKSTSFEFDEYEFDGHHDFDQYDFDGHRDFDHHLAAPAREPQLPTTCSSCCSSLGCSHCSAASASRPARLASGRLASARLASGRLASATSSASACLDGAAAASSSADEVSRLKRTSSSSSSSSKLVSLIESAVPGLILDLASLIAQYAKPKECCILCKKMFGEEEMYSLDSLRNMFQSRLHLCQQSRHLHLCDGCWNACRVERF
mmetsp:Transcript_8439/g.15629  ORF Transcript_8439/g.15629 Transcript_8439/m.15629 type:complete len:220 (-) Transcript_8439:273-932(-)